VWLLNNGISLKKVPFNVITVFACYPLQSEKMVAEGRWVSIVKIFRVLGD
jgi:hypothetical protein